MEQDGYAGLADLVEQQVGLGGAVEHEVEAELLLQPERGGDFGHGVRRDQQGQLALEHLAQGLLGEVARRGLGRRLGVALFPVSLVTLGFVAILRTGFLGLLQLLQVRLGTEQCVAEHRDSLGRCPRRLEVGRHRVAERGSEHPRGDDDGLVDVPAAGLRDHRLAADESSGPVTGVHRRDAVRPHPLDQGLVRVVGVDRAQVGLDRRGAFELILVADRTDVAVQRARESDDGVRVDEAGGDDGGFENLDAVGNARVGGRPDPLDLAVRAGDHDRVFDRRSGNRVQGARANRNLGRGRDRGYRRQGEGEERDSQAQPCADTRPIALEKEVGVPGHHRVSPSSNCRVMWSSWAVVR